VTEHERPSHKGNRSASSPTKKLLRENFRAAKRALGHSIPPRLQTSLRVNAQQFGFSLERGELQILNGSCYVTHTGLLRLARRKKCCGMQVEMVDAFCEPSSDRYVLKATVYPWAGSLGFVGFGDANPSNVSARVRGAEMRVAETRAINRALRKAYGIGLCSLEEMGASSPAADTPAGAEKRFAGGRNGRPSAGRVRDRLCQIIRQHQLDPQLVKAYAVDFCGSTSLKQAPRDQVEAFVQQLAERAMSDRPSLVCQLNSYAHSSMEVVP